MKAVKPVQIPLDTLLKGLRDSKPRYIATEGLRVNLFEMAANLIESLILDADIAFAERREVSKIMDALLPDICKLADLTMTANLGFGSPLCKTEIPREMPDAGQYPEATVISAIVKHEMA